MRCQNVRARGGPPDTHARRAPSIAISDNQPPPSERVLRFGSLGPKDKLASHTRIVASAHRKLEKHHDPHTLIKKHHPEYSRPAAHPRRVEEKPRPSPELRPAGLAVAGALPPPPLFPSRKEGGEGRFALGPLPFSLFPKESLPLSNHFAKETQSFIIFQNKPSTI